MHRAGPCHGVQERTAGRPRSSVVTVLSVDLASRRYRDNGIAILRDRRAAGPAERAGREVSVELVAPAVMRLADPPQPDALAAALHDLAARVGAGLILLDGPQGWRADDSAFVHQRRCEREARTPGKTGLPGIVKPATWTRMAAFSIAVFDALDLRGWPRIDSRWSGGRAAIESFPTQAWRSLGETPLPSGANTPSLEPWRRRLQAHGLRDVPASATHDELQAIVAGLAGIQVARGGFAAADARGCDPTVQGGQWREGWILSPVTES